MPRIPNAAIRVVTARTSGTTEATIAPNANNRMMKVSGRVILIDSSRSREISAVMSSLMKVKLMAWTARFGLAVRAAATIGATGASRAATRVPSPGTRATIRTDDPSGDTRPAAGGAWSGSAS